MTRTKLSELVRVHEASNGPILPIAKCLPPPKKRNCAVCNVRFLLDSQVASSQLKKKKKNNKCGVCHYESHLRKKRMEEEEEPKKNWIVCDVCSKNTLCTQFHPLPCCGNNCGLKFCHSCTGFGGLGCQSCNPTPKPLKPWWYREEIGFLFEKKNK